MNTYQERIKDKFSGFPKGLKKVATYVLKNPEAFAFKSAAQVGEDIGVSETTIIRFCNYLDYRGYSALQKEIQNDLVKSNTTLRNYQTEKQSIGDETIFHKKVMDNDSINIHQTADKINENEFKLAVTKLSEAKNILVAGVRSSYSMAHSLAFNMNIIVGNTHQYNSFSDDIISHLKRLNEDSVVVVFSFPRYALETLSLAKEAKKKGAFIIGITDSAIAPIQEHADVVIATELPAKSNLDTTPVVFSVINALIAGVINKDPESSKARIREYESHELKGTFL